MIAFKPMDSEVEWQWVLDRAHPMQVKDTQGIVAYENTTGNIAGVAAAIGFGGPGAVFWMWVVAVD